jgi:hypothetical protein
MKAEKAIENGVVAGYKTIENGVVSAYKKVEDKFVEAFLTSDETSIQTDSNPNTIVQDGLLTGLNSIKNSVDIGIKAVSKAIISDSEESKD